MEFLFGVSDFGKIKHAEITLGDFTLFVGDNNSGKTFMMQLLYGVLKELKDLDPVVKGIDEQAENRLTYGAEWLQQMEAQINVYLSENKREIIKRIFHREITINELYFHLENIDETYICKIEDYEFDAFAGESGDVVKKAPGRAAQIFVENMNTGEKRKVLGVRFHYYADMKSLKQMLADRIWKMILHWENTINSDALFLPASRTGLQLLSKYFFAERDRKVVSEMTLFDFGDEDNEAMTDNELGLTAPVYDFLQFLLRYNQSTEIGRVNENLLRFIENHLIDGQVKQTGDEIFYRPDTLEDDKEDIPVYLASSLVNEIAPVIKAVNGRYNYRYIFYDEVETCLHPLKQGEMARLIIRLVNSGRRMIVSTHSDTMASKLNNLLLLSFSEDSKEIHEKKLKELGLDNDDLLTDSKVHVYQFANQSDGGSHVEELKFQTVPYIGYDFNLFMRNLDELYNETDIILK